MVGGKQYYRAYRVIGVCAFCVLCFFVGTKLFSIFGTQFSSSEIPLETLSSEVFVEPGVDPVLVASAQTKKLIEMDLKPVINTDNPLDTNTNYKIKKKEIFDLYAAGNRDEQVVQLRLYFASVEGDRTTYDTIARDWCSASPDLCQVTRMPVVSRGKITDSLGHPVAGARVFFFGDEKNTTTSNNSGYYSLTTMTLHPKRMRLIVHHPDFAGGSHTFITTDPRLFFDGPEQIFEKDFTLIKPEQEIVIDVNKKKIISGNAALTPSGYVVENEYSRYLIPFDAIRRTDGSVYKGKVTIRVFEFDRSMANEFLQSDVMSDVYDFASEGLQTYSMPLIFFYGEKGERLEVFSEKPMDIWTTNRELQALITENAAGEQQPGFNPAQYEEATSPENVARYIQEDEKKAYEVSQASPGKFPITLEWTFQNYSRLPGFFVYDHSTGLWESIGYSLVKPSTTMKHSIYSHFWTKK